MVFMDEFKLTGGFLSTMVSAMKAPGGLFISVGEAF
jgi:hypothetical protein